MNLQEFTSPLPKPWLNIVANSIKVSSFESKVLTYSVALRNVLPFSGSSSVNSINIANAVGGVVIVLAGSPPGAVFNMPLSAALDAYINPDVSLANTFTMTVLNKEVTNQANLVGPDGVSVIAIPKAVASGNTTTTMIFSRLSGVWVCAND